MKKKFLVLFICLTLFNLLVHKSLFQKLNKFSSKSELIIPDEKFLTIFIPDFCKPIIADFLWIKLTSKIDLNKKDRNTGEKLYKFMDLITELDPYFFIPYILGGSFLCAKNGYNMYLNGIKILIKGIKNLPEKWELSFLAGYFSYFEQNLKKQGEKFFNICLINNSTPKKIKKLILFFMIRNTSKDEKLKKIKQFLKEIKDDNLKKLLRNTRKN